MPKLNKFIESGEDQPDCVDVKTKSFNVSTFKAIEGFVMVSCIAIELLQICSVRFSSDINRCPFQWLRTQPNKTPSEATTADFMRKSIFHMFREKPDLAILRFIRVSQSSPLDSCQFNID